MGSLTDKYCIVGVGETPHMRPANRTTLSMACEAISNAMADAGLQASDIDGMTSYQVADSTSSAHVATALGMRLNYCLDIFGGGSSTEALVAHAIGLIEAGYAKTIVCFRSMNGRSGRRMGGQIPGGPIPVATAMDDNQFNMGWGWTTPAQRFGMSAMRYLRDTGCTTKAFAEIAVAHRYHASLNPKAIRRSPITIEDHQSSRWVVKPFRLLDCCQETDVSAAIIVTSRERAYDLKHPPVFIMGGYARTMTDNPQWNYSRPVLHYVAGNYGWKRAFGMAGISHSDVDFVSCYDAFTFTTLIQLEANGFCGPGEAGEFVKGGRLQDRSRIAEQSFRRTSLGRLYAWRADGDRKRAPVASSSRRRLSRMARGQAYLRSQQRMSPSSYRADLLRDGVGMGEHGELPHSARHRGVATRDSSYAGDN